MKKRVYPEGIQRLVRLAGKSTNCLTDLPGKTLLELAGRNWQTQPLSQTGFWQQALMAMKAVRDDNDVRIPTGFLDKLDTLMRSFDGQMLVPVAAAQGDFTPWNSPLRNGQLCSTDCEQDHPALPPLCDLFHSQYQSGALIGNQDFWAVRAEIDNRLDCPEWRLFRKNYRMDSHLAEQLYLVYTIPQYLLVYSRQPDWQPQVNRLLTIWNNALTFWLSCRAIMSDRDLLLMDIAFWLHQKPHAAMKFLPAHLLDLPGSATIDLCLPRTTARSLTAWLQEHQLVSDAVVESRSYGNQLSIRCLDDICLTVHMTWSFKWTHLEFMEAAAVWQQAHRGEHGLRIPRPDANQAYIRLSYGLNKTAIPELYNAFFSQPRPMQSPEELLESIRQLPLNRGIRGAWNRLMYGWDRLRSLSFSGADREGASTVMAPMKYRIERKIRGWGRVFRHNPLAAPVLNAWQFGRWQVEQRTVQHLLRQGTNLSRLSLVLRFAYYLADYLIG